MSIFNNNSSLAIISLGNNCEAFTGMNPRELARYVKYDLGEDAELCHENHLGDNTPALLIRSPKDFNNIKSLSALTGDEDIVFFKNGKFSSIKMGEGNMGEIWEEAHRDVYSSEPTSPHYCIQNQGAPLYLSVGFAPQEQSLELEKSVDDDHEIGRQADHLDLVHFSDRVNLASLKPEFQGGGSGGSEMSRLRESREKLINTIPVSYISAYRVNTNLGSHPFETAKAKYHIKIPVDKVYDISADPNNILKQVREENPQHYSQSDSIWDHPDLIHTSIKNAGFWAWEVRGHVSESFKNTVCIYNDIPVVHRDHHPSSGLFAFELEKPMFTPEIWGSTSVKNVHHQQLTKSAFASGASMGDAGGSGVGALTKSEDKHIYIYADGDSAGSAIHQAVLTDQLDKIKDISRRIAMISEILSEKTEDLDGEVILAGGDDFAAQIRTSQLPEFDNLRTLIKEKTGFTVTIGAGYTSPNAVHALLWGKLHGKDQVNTWTQEIQDDVDASMRDISVEEKAAEFITGGGEEMTKSDYCGCKLKKYKPYEPRISQGLSSTRDRKENANQTMEKARYDHKGRWVPEHHDEGVEHERDPNQIGHINQKGEPVWAQSKALHDRQVTNIEKKWNNLPLSNKGKQSFVKLAQAIGRDPDRSAMASGTTPGASGKFSEIRLRHLSHLVNGHPQYSIKETDDGGLSITAQRHSKTPGANGTQTTWEWDNKKLKSAHKDPIGNITGSGEHQYIGDTDEALKKSHPHRESDNTRDSSGGLNNSLRRGTWAVGILPGRDTFRHASGPGPRGLSNTDGVGDRVRHSVKNSTHLTRNLKKSGDKVQAATVIVFDKNGRFLMGQRIDNGKWTMPGGHMNPAEDPETGAVRELMEEAGVSPDEMVYCMSDAVDSGAVVHLFACMGSNPDSSNDPDNEVAQWVWVDASKGIPKAIMSNLQHEQNIALMYMGLQ